MRHWLQEQQPLPVGIIIVEGIPEPSPAILPLFLQIELEKKVLQRPSDTIPCTPQPPSPGVPFSIDEPPINVLVNLNDKNNQNAISLRLRPAFLCDDPSHSSPPSQILVRRLSAPTFTPSLLLPSCQGPPYSSLVLYVSPKGPLHRLMIGADPPAGRGQSSASSENLRTVDSLCHLRYVVAVAVLRAKMFARQNFAASRAFHDGSNTIRRGTDRYLWSVPIWDPGQGRNPYPKASCLPTRCRSRLPLNAFTANDLPR